MKKLDELEALLAKATPGPWQWQVSPDAMRGPNWVNHVLHAPNAVNKTYPGIGIAVLRFDSYPTKVADLDLIAALRNLAPKLIAVARAAQKVATRVAWPDGLVQGDPSAPACIVMRKDHDDLRQAIAALEEP